jgi:hypothetical protein
MKKFLQKGTKITKVGRVTPTSFNQHYRRLIGAETTKDMKHTKLLHCSMISSFFTAFPFVYFVYFVVPTSDSNILDFPRDFYMSVSCE